MPRLDEIRTTSTARDMLEGQIAHLAIVAFMVAGAYWFLRAPSPSPGPGFLGLSGRGWALVSIWLAVAHQIIVAAGFRLQLHRGLLSRLFGEGDMRAWAIVFFPLLLARPLTVLAAGIAEPASLGVWRGGEIVLGLALAVPAAYTMYSVQRYFGFARAMGGDHFRDAYIDMPLVREGAFRLSGNAMYGLGFLMLWSIALLFGSHAALVAAAFQHTYIWVHMLTVEEPDMRWLHPRA